MKEQTQVNPSSPITEFLKELPEFIVADRAMLAVVEQAVKLAQSDMDILILGETGVGKEWLAQVLHRLSSRAAGPFVALNMSTLPEQIFESELFGYERGAFTGATERYEGRFEQAEGGVLFLDEIGHLPLAQQAKLLRVLQEKAFFRLRGVQLVRANVRVVAATSKNLIQMVNQGAFEEALYFRFQVTMSIPPLRKRPDDIQALIRHFLPIYSRDHLKNLASISTEALNYLKQQPWTGNVRQLMNVLKETVVRADPATLVLNVNDFKSALEVWDMSPARLSEDGLSDRLDRLTLDNILELVMLRRLTMYQGNKTKAAKSLGISRQTLYALCKKYEADRAR
jgi:DNA-binding NtrC family response regulator